MTSAHRALRSWPLAVTAVAFACSAQAQMATGTGTNNSRQMNTQSASSTSTGPRQMYSSDSFSAIPYSTNGYIGLNVGQPDWNIPCSGGFGCSESNTAYNIYTGGMFNQNFGAELGYVDFGKFERGGGRTRAAGVNLSLVGNLPLGGFNLYAKVGTIYGRTTVTSNPISRVATGKRSGWEGSYGVGVGLQLSQRSSVVLEWNSYDLNFADVGRRDITTTSLGYVYRF